MLLATDLRVFLQYKEQIAYCMFDVTIKNDVSWFMLYILKYSSLFKS